MRPGLMIATAAVLCLGITTAQATVQVAIDLTHQRMHVDSAEGHFDWPISSARSGFYTPGGSFAPTHLERMHYSHKYHMSPMPHAIFFRGGYAIHGTYSTASLGQPASHGCVRLSPGHAAALYDMVRTEGGRISISGAPPATRTYDARREVSPADDQDADGYPPSRRAPRRSGMVGGYGYTYGAQPYGDGYGAYGYGEPPSGPQYYGGSGLDVPEALSEGW